jgi:hypothetical protein
MAQAPQSFYLSMKHSMRWDLHIVPESSQKVWSYEPLNAINMESPQNPNLSSMACC